MTGFINVWKREGDTSAYVVNRLKRLTRTPCGHMGTLDPLASGVLPVGIGNATRLFDYFLDKKKVYLAHFRFGVTTPTLDYESEPVVGGSIPTAPGDRNGPAAVRRRNCADSARVQRKMRQRKTKLRACP